MAVRPSMAALIQRVRGLTYAGTAEFSVGSDSYYSDQHVQDYLDAHRRDVQYAPLAPVPLNTVNNGSGSVSYYDYQAPYGNWEATSGGTAVLIVHDAIGSAIGTAAWSLDPLRGLVTFGQETLGSARYVTGRVYDLYGAAADLLESWAAREARAFDYSGDGQTLTRSQKAKGLRDQAAEYRAKAWPVTVRMTRSDLACGDEGRYS